MKRVEDNKGVFAAVLVGQLVDLDAFHMNYSWLNCMLTTMIKNYHNLV